MLAILAALTLVGDDVLVFRGNSGAGQGKHVVLLAGDEEYRSEEALPMLGRLLAERHGFTCTVSFSVNEKGEIDPERQTNQPGIETLKRADLAIMMLRFRRWPDEQMRHFVDFYEAGKPIIALRTSTHAFAYPSDSTSVFRRFGWNSTEWPGGFGKQVLGETWVSHWGDHGHQATRGVPAPGTSGHPLLTGVSDVFGDTDVYEAAPPSDAEILLLGEVVGGMSQGDSPASGKKRTAAGVEQGLNDPMMPVAWLRQPTNERGRRNWILTTTMGAATDLQNEGLRRLLVNGVYLGLGLSVPARADVRTVGDYRPSKFGFGAFVKGRKPSDLGGTSE